MMSALPLVRMKEGRERRLKAGHPWAYANEIEMDADARALPPGTLTRIARGDGTALGVGFFNPHPLIAFRLISREPDSDVGAALFARRLRRALDVRERLYRVPHYRLIHAEADGFPGLVVDRFGDTAVLQINTAGIELLTDDLLQALDEVLCPRTVVLRNDSTVRRLEALDTYVRIVKGNVNGLTEVLENGCVFFADVVSGQKTGWFFDQRDNRAFIAALARGKRMADFYCFSGGFGVAAAAAGAASVRAYDRSQPALDLACQAAEANRVGERCRFERGNAFHTMHRLADGGEVFDAVVVDPPAFVKTRKDVYSGMRGYRKLARLAAGLVAPGGILLVASCSHHVDLASFSEQVRRGLADAGRGGRVLRTAGAAPDHPVHPFLPESAYLKAQVLQLD
ncbi:MAG: class I SAM-dependent rRNA methyltransferase [Alphaproteobacteria bacterium]